ncbi:MAG: hypothetical protein D6788_11030, partial [Planctomycetota bacterium]
MSEEIRFAIGLGNGFFHLDGVSVPQHIDGKDPQLYRASEHSASVISVRQLPLPGRHQVADPPHALCVPKNLSYGAELVDVERRRTHQIHR